MPLTAKEKRAAMKARFWDDGIWGKPRVGL
jgi:hypothetical protein